MKKALILFIISVMILISLLIIKSYTKSTEPPPPKRNLKSIESLVPPAPKKPIKKERINDTQRETGQSIKFAKELEVKGKMYREKRENCREKCKTTDCSASGVVVRPTPPEVECLIISTDCYKSCMF
jgi:hypothetical protein